MAAAAGGTPASSPPGRGLRLFQRARQQHEHLGLFEIGPEHKFYSLTCQLRAGLSAATQVAIDHPPAGTPCEGDCTAVLKQPHEGFELHTYAGPAFARLRRTLGLPEEQYQASLSSRYFQFISNSKSKADFFLTEDKRFFLKMQKQQEIRFLLANLPRYLRHLETFPHSLLVRLLGAHSIILPCRRKRYFIITQSIFFPDERILERYDIKGCRVNRWAQPAPKGSAAAVVLKDLNFEGKSLVLGARRPWLLRQLELDSRFLEELRVLDYSLLLAVQPLHPDGCAARTPAPCRSLPGSGTGTSQNQRPLPASSNPLHSIDGPQWRYLVGLVDLFTVYSFRRRLEHLWKSIRYRDGSFSTVHPAAYARRLCRWVETHSE